MEKKIIICVGTDINKSIRIRLSLMIVDQESVLSEQYHSVSIFPGADLLQIRTAIEAHLSTPNGGIPGAPWPKIPDEEWAEVEQIASILHTPERIQKRRETDAKNELALTGIKNERSR